MATAVLTVVGGIVGGALTGGNPAGVQIGAFLGASIGAQVDQQLIFPALFPKPEIFGGTRIRDLSVTGVSEGSPVQWVIGDRVRTPCQLLWVGKLKERRKKTSVGGKGGDSQKVVNFLYYVDVAVGFGRGPIERVMSITGDGKNIYNFQSPEVRTVAGCTAKLLVRPQTGRGSRPVQTSYQLLIESSVSSALGGFEESSSESIFRGIPSGASVQIAGFADAANNGTFTVLRSENTTDQSLPLPRPTSSRLILQANRSIVENLTPVTITVTFQRDSFDKARLAGITTYAGTETQGVDPVIDAAEPRASAFRGVAYAVLQDLALEFYGNRLPQFQCVTKPLTTVKPSDAVKSIFKDVGLIENTDYSIAGVNNSNVFGTGDETVGLPVAGLVRAREALTPLAVAYRLVAQEKMGMVKVLTRGGGETVTVAEGDLAPREVGANRPRAIVFKPLPDVARSSDVVVQYLDRNSLERGSVVQRRRGVPVNRRSIDLNVAITPNRASVVAGEVVWGERKNRIAAELLLPPKYLGISPNDVLEVTYKGEVYSILLVRVRRGANYILECQGVVESIATFEGYDDDLQELFTAVDQPPRIDLRFLNVASLRDTDVSTVGVYYAVETYEAEEEQIFRGGTLFLSRDGGDSFRPVDVVSARATVGFAGDINLTRQALRLRQTVVDGLPEADPPQDSAVLYSTKQTALSSTFAWQLVTDPLGVGINPTVPYQSYRVVVNFDEAETYSYEWHFNDATYVEPNWTAGRYEVHISNFRFARGVNDARVTIKTNTGNQVRFINQNSRSEPRFPVVDGNLVISIDDDGEVGFLDVLSVKIDLDDAVQGPNFRLFGVYECTLVKIDPQNLPPGPFSSGPYLDRKNKFRVTLLSGALESVSFQGLRQGDNLCVLGNEVMQFQDATLIATGVYELSNLVRGLRDTGRFVEGHQRGEPFALVDPDTVKFLPFDISDIGTDRLVKVVSPGEQEALVGAESFEIVGATLRPFSPVKLRAAPYGGSSGVVISWKGRSRVAGGLFGVDGTPTLESERFVSDDGNLNDTAKYEVEVRDGPANFVINTYEVRGESWDYTTTLQGNDGVSSTDQLVFRVFQISRVVGRGEPSDDLAFTLL